MLGKRLKKLRKERGLLQKDIAQILNITTSAYGYYEQDKRDPDTKTLRILADFYNVSVDYLLGRTNIRNPYDDISSISSKEFSDIDELSPESKKELEKFIELLKLKDKMEMDKSNDETSSALDGNA